MNAKKAKLLRKVVNIKAYPSHLSVRKYTFSGLSVKNTPDSARRVYQFAKKKINARARV